MINVVLATLLFFSSVSKADAICADGWISQSSGRGTCSHHGGVSSWLVPEQGVSVGNYGQQPNGTYIMNVPELSRCLASKRIHREMKISIQNNESLLRFKQEEEKEQESILSDKSRSSFYEEYPELKIKKKQIVEQLNKEIKELNTLVEDLVSISNELADTSNRLCFVKQYGTYYESDVKLAKKLPIGKEEMKSWAGL